jgi:hypothetical protein
MVKRTSHGKGRHADAGRPTSEAARDQAAAREIYRDTESGNYLLIGPRGRTHVFTVDGQHHTSFRTTRANRQKRMLEGRRERIEFDELPFEVK